MTEQSPTPLVERVAVAMWNTWNRVMVEYGLHKQSNGDFYDAEPTDDPIKAEAHRLLRKAAIDEAQAALDTCQVEALLEVLRTLVAAKYEKEQHGKTKRYIALKYRGWLQARTVLRRLDKGTSA